MRPACDADDAIPPRIVALSPDRGLEQELALLRSVAGGHADRGRLIWSTRQCLVVPRFMARLPKFAEASTVLEEEGWPVYVRDTGGDVYPQGAGIVNVAIAFRLDRGDYDRIGSAYAELCDPIVDAANDCELPACCDIVSDALCPGSHDIVIAGRKFAGVAQRWRRATSSLGPYDAALVHAGLLCVGDVTPLVSIVNQFYRYCSLDRHAAVDSHTTLFPDRDLADGWSMTARLVARITEHLDRKAGTATFLSDTGRSGRSIRPATAATG